MANNKAERKAKAAVEALEAATIKVHVTPEERDILQLLVNRRWHDVKNHVWGNARPSDGELELLTRLKWELEQAGT